MSTLSPNMSLPISTVAVDSGLNWENNLNSSLNLIDSHNHSPGYGVQIQPSGLNINSDLAYNNNNLTLVRSVRFQSQPAALALASDLGCLYESGVDLYYNDGSGNQIRITQGGSITGAAGTITGLPSGTASAAYAAGVFTFQSATATGANIDGASFVFRNNTANSKGLTLSPPNAMGANYSLTLPPLPVATSFLQIDTSGAISGSIAISGGLTTTNLSASAGIVGTQLANQTITSTQIANLAVSTAQLDNGAVTGAKISTGTITDGKMTPGTLTGTSMSSNIDLPGKSVTVGSQKVVASGSNAATGLVVGRASFNDSGTTLVGEGITCTRNSAGNYTINFTSLAFASDPSVIATTGNSTYQIITVGSVNSTTATILIGPGVDSYFQVFVIGPRA